MENVQSFEVRKVENGWVLYLNSTGFRSGELDKIYVFSNSKDLGIFVRGLDG